MITRFVSAALVAASLLVGSITAASAETWKVSLGMGEAFMTFPDSWKVTTIKRGIQAVSPDEEVYIWAEAFTPDQWDAISGEHDKYYTKQKVSLGKPKSSEGTIAGVKGVAFEFPATYKGEKTVVQYLILDPALKNQAKLMLSTWASVAGDKKHQPATDAMLKSLKFK